jgi:hypothetical protein
LGPTGTHSEQDRCWAPADTPGTVPAQNFQWQAFLNSHICSAPITLSVSQMTSSVAWLPSKKMIHRMIIRRPVLGMPCASLSIPSYVIPAAGTRT